MLAVGGIGHVIEGLVTRVESMISPEKNNQYNLHIYHTKYSFTRVSSCQTRIYPFHLRKILNSATACIHASHCMTMVKKGENIIHA